MKTCDKCNYIEDDYNEGVFVCDCVIKLNNLDGILREIEDNFESLWEANK